MLAAIGGATTVLIHKAGPNLGSLIGALIFFFTVLGTFCLGIFAAYASVVGILRALAPRPQQASQPVLGQSQTHAAHAGGD
jgi:branched-subunit amino acid ABC-type transport system permease component